MKFAVGKCKKYSKYVVFQVQEQSEDEGKIVGMFTSKDKPCDTDVYTPTLISDTPCQVCGNTRLGGCSHSERLCNGKPGQACKTCSQMEIDYSCTTKSKQYGNYAGMNDIPGAKDIYNNYAGNDGDLGRDGAFQGKKVIVLWLCYSGTESETNIRKVLSTKGFSVDFYTAKNLPSAQALSVMLQTANQLWLVAEKEILLNEDYYKIIIDFYKKGKGLYLLGDNAPFFADVNVISQKLFGTELKGDYIGDKVIGVSEKQNDVGIIKGHLMSTGICNFYEGITISNVEPKGGLKPLVYSSDGKVAAAYFDKFGRRLLIDGGFTRLYFKWDTAGTDRYVKNAAVWLANIERFN